MFEGSEGNSEDDHTVQKEESECRKRSTCSGCNQEFGDKDAEAKRISTTSCA